MVGLQLSAEIYSGNPSMMASIEIDLYNIKSLVMPPINTPLQPCRERPRWHMVQSGKLEHTHATHFDAKIIMP